MSEETQSLIEPGRLQSGAVLDLGDELNLFRRQIRSWLEENVPAGLSGIVDWYDGTTILAGSNRDVRTIAEASVEYRTWADVLLSERLVYPHWPLHAGGKGWTEVQTAIFAEECHRLGVPRVKRGFSADLVGTALLLFGTIEQQEHFLPRIVNGIDRYCQGFSEPNHGSDLGAIETTGVRRGDDLVITGQKVWTSAFAEANMMFLVCRTDPEAARNQALSFVLLPFGADNNIVIKGIRQMTGAVEFAEEFLDGAQAPMFNVIGGLGNGWHVAMATLATERTADLPVSHLGYLDEFHALLERAREVGASADPVVRQRLADAYVDVQVLRAQAAIALARTARGESPGALEFVSKLQWSEYGARLGDLAVDLAGERGIVRPDPGTARVFEEDYAVDRWQDLLLSSRGATIFSGSNEIQRNIIAEQVLGLPREPRGAARERASR